MLVRRAHGTSARIPRLRCRGLAQQQSLPVSPALVGPGGRAFVGAAGVATAAFVGWYSRSRLLGSRGTEDCVDGVTSLVGEPSSRALRLAQPEEFKHPYCSEPLLWRMWFTARRSLFLLYNFLPLVKAALLDVLFAGTSAGERYHARFLDALFDSMASGGCSTQKFGQWISMRPDMFPTDVVERLSQLQCDAPAHSWAVTLRLVEESFGDKLEGIFEEFERTPTASGSVAQVHRARLRPEHALPGGMCDVAVKVRHPTVLEESYIDMAALFGTLGLASLFAPFPMEIPFAQNEFYQVLAKQMSMRWEAFNLLKFARNFSEDVLVSGGLICFPSVSTTLLSDAILVESWAPGVPISEIYGESQPAEPSTEKKAADKLQALTMQERRKMAETLFDININMFLRDNFVHGDLHAGNLLYDAASHRITVLDAGLTTSLPPEDKQGFVRFLRAMCAKNTAAIADGLVSFHDDTVGPCCVGHQCTREAFAAEVAAVFKHYAQKDAELAEQQQKQKQIAAAAGRNFTEQHEQLQQVSSIGEVMGTLTQRLGRYGIVLRGEISTCIMTISVSEGLLLQLDPAFDIVQKAMPYLLRSKVGLLQDSLTTS